VGILVGKQPQESFSFFVMPGAGALEEIDRQLRADGVSPAGVPQRVGEIAFCVGYATACLRTDLAEDQRRAQQEKILGAARQAGIDLRQNLDIDSDGNLRGIRRSVFAI
jgi:hypothetical protein